jgi:hypothetical protein
MVNAGRGEVKNRVAERRGHAGRGDHADPVVALFSDIEVPCRVDRETRRGRERRGHRRDRPGRREDLADVRRLGDVEVSRRIEREPGGPEILADVADPSSPENSAVPVPATVVIKPVAALIMRTRLFAVSEKYTFPAASIAISPGRSIAAAVAGPPSPENAAVPFPVIQNAVVHGNPGGHAVVVLDGCTVDPPAFRLA